MVACPDPRTRGAGRVARATSPSARPRRSRRISRAHHATTAALIVEPLVQGAAGMAMYDAHYLARARELCTARYGVLLIADEIMTGFGRTGTLFACEQAGAAAPDFLCLSKGITGGYLPLSCVLTTDAVYDAFYDDDAARGFLHSHCYTGNALACRAALAMLDIFRDDDVIAANRGRGARWYGARGAARRAPAGARLPAARHDLSPSTSRPTRPGFRALVLRARPSRASCCCARSAAPSTSCRPTSSPTTSSRCSSTRTPTSSTRA